MIISNEHWFLGQKKMVEFLIINKINLDAANIDNETALHVAVHVGELFFGYIMIWIETSIH